MDTQSISLDPGNYEQLKSLLLESRETWGRGFTPGDYVKFHLRLGRHEWRRDRYRHMVLANRVGKVLSSCEVHEQQGYVHDRPIRIAQLGALYTPEKRRGRGSASSLLELLTARLADEGFDIAVLFSEIGVTYFEQFGFREIPQRDLVFDLMVPAKPRKKVIESFHKVPETVMSLYKKLRFSNFGIERSPRYWDMLRLRRNLFNRMQWDMGHESLHIREDGAAYAWTLWNGDSLLVRDISYRSNDAVADVFAYIFRKHGPGVLSGVRGPLPECIEKIPFLKSKRREKPLKAFMIADLSGKNTDLLEMRPGEIQFYSLDRL